MLTTHRPSISTQLPTFKTNLVISYFIANNGNGMDASLAHDTTLNDYRIISVFLHLCLRAWRSQPFPKTSFRETLYCSSVHHKHIIFENRCQNVLLCVYFQQQAFNAASVIHHMQKLQASHSEPSTSTLSMPNIIVQSSQNDLEAMGPCHDEANILDPNGNPVAGTALYPPLRASHSQPAHALNTDESGEVHNFHSEGDALFRPSKRWELPSCSSCWKTGHFKFTTE